MCLDERVRTTALNAKIRQLEQERDSLAHRLEKYEPDDASHDLGGSLISSTDADDELLNDTKPTFSEQVAFMKAADAEAAAEDSDSHSDQEVCLLFTLLSINN